MTLIQVWQLLYYWSRDVHSFKEVQHVLRRQDGSTIGNHTYVDWMNFFRDICAQHFISQPVKIGGPGLIVEIDETVFVRRKYNRVRLVRHQWVFGGVQRGSPDKCFMVAVDKRNADTLLPIIQEYVLPGTDIISDLWAAYRRIAELPEGYGHLTVNHSVNFVDPGSGAHTNTIEGSWQKLKQGNKKRFGTHEALFETYLQEFMWRRKFAGVDAAFTFWSQVAEIYPCE